MNSTLMNRKAQYAGQFYPGTKPELKKELDMLFQWANHFPTEPGHIRALIVPHAGYMFSGRVAASAYAQFSEEIRYKRIFILGSSHRYSFNGVSVYSEGNYVTPMGEVKVDQELCRELIKKSPIFFDHKDAHQEEHSLEVQLPFLQHKFGKSISLVPLIIGTKRSVDCAEAAKVLKPYFSPENLFIVSSDFSHYPGYNDAKDVDDKTAEMICSGDPDSLLRQLERNEKRRIHGLQTSLCGWTSVLTLLEMVKGSDLKYNKISYENSGDSPGYGDKNRVVGYWAISLVDRQEEFSLNEHEQNELLAKARHAIKHFLKDELPPELIPTSKGTKLQEHLGCFVSIYIDGELRGCIGGFEQGKPLSELCQRMAVSAARDRRFDTILPEEIGSMELEISVLSPLKSVLSSRDIIPGKHGILIRKDEQSGTFLPQVATRTGWTAEELLGRCSRDKAGLGWDGWKDAELFTYEAFVFRD